MFGFVRFLLYVFLSRAACVRYDCVLLSTFGMTMSDSYEGFESQESIPRDFRFRGTKNRTHHSNRTKKKKLVQKTECDVNDRCSKGGRTGS